jgi:hypothetical protein
VKFTELPTWIVAALGAIVPFRVATKSCAGTLWLRLPLVPVIVNECAFALAARAAGTFTVIVAVTPEAVGVMGGGAEQVMPAGSAPQVSVTGCLNPFDSFRTTL